ncbi:MBL fold metallo-hydrolase [Saccharothrix sp. ALI-22-I]|uniref:MBL fold metallo-hydrolase n=1 Tax=Saccharothrix sp. ALI-22-I TaxID=1933778 RepID=UPI00097CB441|nr:MBL fold metallo-hydrolase [Saccharothrix sp. ALI-22-I]ONI81894.1 MBL fold metallo-hydrolase [Saccharothrix sp. ALI-22-I]
MSGLAYGVLRQVTPTAAVLLAENPGVMTLDGTNTWVLRAPGSSSCVVVDPGPADAVHLGRIAAQAPVEVVLLTHGHPDHSDGARSFGRQVNAPVRSVDPAFRLGGQGLAEGEVIEAAGLSIRVLPTPGHTADSVCFQLDDAVLTGDTVLGRGTTVVAHPDGKLGDYLASLRLLAALPVGTVGLPGHGPELPDVVAAATGYLAHREQRLAQVRAAVAQLGGAPTPREVVELVYADVDRSLWPAAEWSVRAQLEYLRDA